MANLNETSNFIVHLMGHRVPLQCDLWGKNVYVVNFIGIAIFHA